jgi:hypothetical protein
VRREVNNQVASAGKHPGLGADLADVRGLPVDQGRGHQFEVVKAAFFWCHLFIFAHICIPSFRLFSFCLFDGLFRTRSFSGTAADVKKNFLRP